MSPKSNVNVKFCRGGELLNNTSNKRNMTLPIPYKSDSDYVSDMIYRKEIYVEFVLKISGFIL